jgi:hypothetical protein
MWHIAHARTCGCRPCPTIAGMGGCSSGNQSPTSQKSRICAVVNDRWLPGMRFSDVSAGGAVPAGAAALCGRGNGAAALCARGNGAPGATP